MINRLSGGFDRARLASDRGISITELIVTMALTSLVLALVGLFFVQIAQATTTANDARVSTSTVANIANEISDAIRPATTLTISGNVDADPAIVAGSGATAIIFYTYADNTATDVRPIRFRFEVNAAKQLVESRWVASMVGGLWTFPAITTTPTTTRTFPGKIVDPTPVVGVETTSSAPLFNYLDSTGAALVPAGTSLSDTQRANVAAVRFTIRVVGEFSKSSKMVVIQNTVGMPNIGLQAKDDS